jgi:hypothetical protein
MHIDYPSELSFSHMTSFLPVITSGKYITKHTSYDLSIGQTYAIGGEIVHAILGCHLQCYTNNQRVATAIATGVCCGVKQHCLEHTTATGELSRCTPSCIATVYTCANNATVHVHFKYAIYR